MLLAKHPLVRPLLLLLLPGLLLVQLFLLLREAHSSAVFRAIKGCPNSPDLPLPPFSAALLLVTVLVAPPRGPPLSRAWSC